MAEEISKVVLQLVADATGLVAGVAAGQKSMTELNQTMELSRKAFGLLQGAYTTLESVLDRGQAVSKLTDAFNQLQAKAGNLATGELKALSAASQGVISDFDLMRNSNQALLSGIKPDQFRIMAEAAGGLADAVGGDAKQALDDLTKALSSGATAGLEKTYGLVIDNAKAYEDFAKTIKATGDQLNEIGKREAVRIAAIEKLKERTKEATESNLTAKEGLEKLQVASERVFDRLAQAVNENKNLASAFEDLATSISTMDLGPLVKLVDLLTTIASIGVSAITSTGKGIGLAADAVLDRTFNLSIEEQIRERNLELERIQSNGSRKSFLGGRSTAEIEKMQAEVTRLAQEIGGLQRAKESIDKSRFESNLGGFIGPNAPAGFFANQERDKFLNQEKLKAESAKAIEEAAKVEAARAKLRQQFVLDGLKLESDTFKGGIEQALEQFDFGSAQGFFQRYEASLAKATEEGLRASLTDDTGKLTVSEAELKSRVQSTIGPQIRAVEAEITESMNESFNNSVSFFADILTPMFEGQAANFEDIFRDAGKRVAIGFASQIAASVATSLGFTGISNIAGAQGLGQSIAAALGFGGGGVTSITDIFGDGGVALSASAVALDGAAAAHVAAASALMSAAGAQAAGGVPGVPKVLSAEFIPGMETLLTKAGIGAAVLVATAITAKSGFDSFKAGQQGGIGAGVRAGFNSIDDLGAAFASGGLSIPINLAAGIAGSFFGGDSRKSQEREARESILDELFGGDFTFGRANRPGGQLSVDPSEFNIDIEGDNIQDTAKVGALVSPIAQILTGGKGKLTDDLTGIFTNSVGEAENFNEVIANTQALMDRLGLSFEDAKSQLSSLFLDGKIGLNDFGEGLYNLNIAAQEDLIGDDSINDAFRILAENLGPDGDPRVALRGFALAFKEMADQGIDTQEEIIAFVTENFSPEIVAAFEDILETGTDTFDEILAAAENGDLLFLIINQLTSVKDGFSDLISTKEDYGDSDAHERQAQQIEKERTQVQGLSKDYRELEKAKKAAAGTTIPGAPPVAGETGLSRSPG